MARNASTKSLLFGRQIDRIDKERGDSFMSRKWIAVIASVAMVYSAAAFAQDESSGGATSPNAPIESTSPAAPPDSDVTTPNAPVQPTDEGPAPAGSAAGTSAAAGFALGTTTLVAIGAVAVAAAVCLAACGGGSNTSSTTTTSPK
jgi:hypothetical protein